MENLQRYRKQLRRYLRLKGIEVGASGELRCPNPQHSGDTLALLEEDDPGRDWIECPACMDKRDIYDVCGFLEGIEIHKHTFPRRAELVAYTLAEVEAEIPAELASKPIAQWTDEELKAQVARQKVAAKATREKRRELDSLKVAERRRQYEDKAQDLPFRVLGTADDGLTYVLDRSQRLQALRLGSLSKTQLQLLAPITWWLTQFPGSRGRLDTEIAIDFVIDIANGRDFDLASLRGRGAWRERDGSLCYHDGAKTYGRPNPRRIYQKKTRIDLGLDSPVASPEARAGMLDAAAQMSFETQADCARLLAWSALAPFCGALPWRPAGFLTGASKSGKSTILNYVVTKLAHPLFISGDSTAAFIRQETGNDCLPVVIDEAEAQSDYEHRRMTDVWALMRQSTSDDAPRIGKGSTSGRAISYMTRNMYLFSAISPGVEKQADANRMFVVDLKRPDNDWSAVRRLINETFTDEACAGVRAFTWAHLAEIIEQAEAIAEAIQDVAGLDTRYALLEGILWAAHWRVWRDRFPEDAELREWLERLYRLKAPEQPEDDAVVLLQRVLAEVVQLQDAPSRRHTIQHMALALSTSLEARAEEELPAMPLFEEDATRYQKTLHLYGMHVPRRGEYEGCLALSIRHPWLARVMATTMSYAKVLGRHPLCLSKSMTITPTGEPSRKCLMFSRGVLEGEPPI